MCPESLRDTTRCVCAPAPRFQIAECRSVIPHKCRRTPLYPAVVSLPPAITSCTLATIMPPRPLNEQTSVDMAEARSKSTVDVNAITYLLHGQSVCSRGIELL